MTSNEGGREFRVGVIAALTQRAAGGLGRTAIMKLAYFLQILKGVPLGYSFRLYTYGPYDAQVIEDVKFAELQGAISSAVVSYPSGCGYAITPGERAAEAVERSRALVEHALTLDWVVTEFGNRSAIDLEMASTIVYVDRANQVAGRYVAASDLAASVRSIKPRLDMARIMAEIDRLGVEGLLTSIARPEAA
jgi:uncharacterized protein